MEQAGYAAFLSYSHRDQRWAEWLHRALETYAVPRHLAGRDTPAGPLPRRLRPVFRDRDELAASADLGARIEAALAASRAFVVLCSPDAAASRWTNQEIATFKRLHPDRPILAAIIAGEPYASAIPGREHEEAFPPALRYRVDAQGALTNEPAEPIAADFRTHADGRRLGKLKIVAGMLGVGLDELVRRDAARRARRLAWLSAAALAGMAGTSALAVFASEQRAEAVRQREQADGLVEFMLTDLRARLEPVGRLDVLDDVGERALRYYGAQKVSRLDADALGRRARALLLVGEVADARGNSARARESFGQAARTTGELLARDPDNWQRVYDHAQSAYWIGEVAGERGDVAERTRWFETYHALAETLVRLRPGDRTSLMEAAYSDINLGLVYRQAGSYGRALASFRSAGWQLQRVSPRDREAVMPLAETHAHASSVLMDMGADGAAIAERDKQIALLSAPPFKASDNDVVSAMAAANSFLGKEYLIQGDLPRSERALAASARFWNRLVEVDPTNKDTVSQRAQTMTTQAILLFAQRRFDAARRLVGTVLGDLDRLHRQEPGDAAVTTLLMAARTAAVRFGVSSAAAPLRQMLSDRSQATASIETSDQKVALANALIAAGDECRLREPGSAAAFWRQAAALLATAQLRNTLSEIDRQLIVTRLSQPAASTGRKIDLSIAFGGIYAANIQ